MQIACCGAICACVRGELVFSAVDVRIRSVFTALAGSLAQLSHDWPSPEYMQSMHQTSVSRLM